uniref:Uncharacterized protein n=1 Tax=Anguilla anguilla TaxID=7936 RepID=A0A0E9R2S1_ANGAN
MYVCVVLVQRVCTCACFYLGLDTVFSFKHKCDQLVNKTVFCNKILLKIQKD